MPTWCARRSRSARCSRAERARDARRRRADRRRGARDRARRRRQHQPRDRAAVRAAGARRGDPADATRRCEPPPSGCSAQLDVDDAAAAFAAIVAARPGGLGEAPEHDVREPARVSLREAMAAAAHRDSIASEYATGYAIVFDSGLPLLTDALRDGARTLERDRLAARRPARHPPRHADRAQGGRRGGAARSARRRARCATARARWRSSTPRCAGADHRLNPGHDRRPRRRDAAGRAAVRGAAAVSRATARCWSSPSARGCSPSWRSPTATR